jgi:hypothetical protein
MSDPQAESKQAPDPLAQWRELRDAYIDIWAKATVETVNTEAYAQASGAMLETYLTASSPFRDAQKKLMVSALEQLNMPSRADFVSLAERLANLEMLLDDMAAKLNQIHQLATGAAPPPARKAESEPLLPAAPKTESEDSQPALKAESVPSLPAPKAGSEDSLPAPKAASEMKSAAFRKTGKNAKKGSR